MMAEMLRPKLTLEDDISAKNQRQKKATLYYFAMDLPALKEGDLVWVRLGKLGDRKWKRGEVIAKCNEPQSNHERLSDGSVRCCNRQDLKLGQCKKRAVIGSDSESSSNNETEKMQTNGVNVKLHFAALQHKNRTRDILTITIADFSSR